MHLFPESSYRSGRRLLVAAVILSLIIHLVGGGIWGLFLHTVASATKGSPLEVVAVSEAITIERRSVPRASRRARSSRPAQTPPVRHLAVRAQPALPVPTLPPLADRPAPARHERPAPPVPRVVAHRQIAVVAPPPAAASSRSAFSPQQMMALNDQFRRTIDSAQREVSEGPPQTGSSSDTAHQYHVPAADQLRYQQIMSGTPEEVLAGIRGAGDCVVLDGPNPSGAMRAYYIRCTIHYSDGFFEQVSFPWPFRFTPRKDPFDYRVNPNGLMSFPGQPPPDGFTLPRNFALSRAVCSFFRPQCQAIINDEIRRGDPSYGKPP